MFFFKKKKDKPKRPVLQEYFFRQALEEVGIVGGEIKIDHQTGKCWHSETGWRPITFPKSLVDEVANISKEKTEDYFFRGVISEGREWLRNFENVEESYYGRKKETKYQTDIEYYKKMCAARFGLAPVGDCPWSYRFFESIMCFSIPVIGQDDNDIYSDKFIYLRSSSKHEYDKDGCRYNYDVFIRDHTL